MGTCQANFCALRSAGVFSRCGQTDSSNDSLGQMKEFLQGRWKGIRPVLMGRTLREIEMTRALYELSFQCEWRRTRMKHSDIVVIDGLAGLTAALRAAR